MENTMAIYAWILQKLLTIFRFMERILFPVIVLCTCETSASACYHQIHRLCVVQCSIIKRLDHRVQNKFRTLSAPFHSCHCQLKGLFVLSFTPAVRNPSSAWIDKLRLQGDSFESPKTRVNQSKSSALFTFPNPFQYQYLSVIASIPQNIGCVQ